MIDELLGWYLAPWRRMDRVHFGFWLGVATVPVMLLMFFGLLHDASGWLAPVMSLMDLMGHLQQGGDLNAALQGLQQTEAQVEQVSAVQVHGFPWGSFVNSILQLLMIPLCRMRLRDMGKTWPMELVWALVVNLTAVYGLIGILGGPDDLPGSTIFGIVSFVGYIWLCAKASAPRVAPHEHIPPRQEA